MCLYNEDRRNAPCLSSHGNLFKSLEPFLFQCRGSPYSTGVELGTEMVQFHQSSDGTWAETRTIRDQFGFLPGHLPAPLQLVAGLQGTWTFRVYGSIAAHYANCPSARDPNNYSESLSPSSMMQQTANEALLSSCSREGIAIV